MMTVVNAGHLLKIKDGKVVDDRKIPFDQLFNMGKTQLEKQCIYLMKKRIALEDALVASVKKGRGLINAVKNRDRDIKILTKEVSDQQQLMSVTLERINKENNATLSEIVDENVRLNNKITEMERTCR